MNASSLHKMTLLNRASSHLVSFPVQEFRAKRRLLFPPLRPRGSARSCSPASELELGDLRSPCRRGRETHAERVPDVRLLNGPAPRCPPDRGAERQRGGERGKHREWTSTDPCCAAIIRSGRTD